MRQNRRNLIIAILLVILTIVPTVASAATFYNLKITINGQTQAIQIPLEQRSGTYHFTYVYKDGKWVLTQNNSNNKVTPVVPGTTKTPAPTKPAPSPVKPPVDDNETTQPQTQGLTADEQKMLNLINAERKKAGLQPLAIDMRLVTISRLKSKDMIDKNYFSHTSPTYGSPFDMLKAHGVSYRYAGENLAGASTVERAHTNLMNSPGHRANILNPNYNYVGIGIVDGGSYGKMFTQIFIGTK